MYFTITTNKEVAEQIGQQCAFEAKHNDRSYTLGDVSHNPGYSVVQIVAKKNVIKPGDIFWLGRYSADVPVKVIPPASNAEDKREIEKLKEMNSLLKNTVDVISTRLNAFYEKINIPKTEKLTKPV